LAECKGVPAAACLAVAGPVEKNAVNFTNRNWVINGAKLEAKFGIAKVKLINDFVANGYGLLTLDEKKECVTLQEAPKVEGSPIACVGAGTGLGECFSTSTDAGTPYETYASEGGHGDWAPRSALEVELLEFMKSKFGGKHRVSVERVISGPGLATMYEFFSGKFPSKVVPEVHAAIEAAGEMKGKFISKHSQKVVGMAHCELCKLTMDTFAAAYGAEAGVAALKWIPLGGLYIAGGLTPKNLSLLRGDDSAFMQAFRDKGRLSPLIRRVPVYAVLAEDIGQRGAHLVAFRLIKASLPTAQPKDLPMVNKFFNMLKQNAVAASPPLESEALVLVGDVGGTNSRLQMYAVPAGAFLMSGEKAPGTLVHEAQYLNGDFEDFDQIVETFLAECKGVPAAACLAVAGPVEKNAVNFTNRNWVINGAKLEAKFGIAKVKLINDFVANGYGLLTLDEKKECVTLQEAPKVEGSPIACVGAGTGLGECFSTSTDAGTPYETYASEGGHGDWAPRSALEVELLEFMKSKFGGKHRVSVERVISGPGLATMYEFFSGKFPSKVVPEVHAAIEAAGEMKGKFISKHSQKVVGMAHCELCKLTMDTFAAAYGAEAGVAALKWIPLGGLYIAGGLTPKNLSLLRGDDSAFMQAFRDKGRLSPLIRRVPVYAVLAEDIGQRGAHLVAFRLLISAQETAREMVEFAVTKHSVWATKGSYKRTLCISKTELVTKDPISGMVTNRWPTQAICTAKPIEDSSDGPRFVLQVQQGGLFCGMQSSLTFSVADEAIRARFINLASSASAAAC